MNDVNDRARKVICIAIAYQHMCGIGTNIFAIQAQQTLIRADSEKNDKYLDVDRGVSLFFDLCIISFLSINVVMINAIDQIVI